jgi:lysophospholipase L1-like esterase
MKFPLILALTMTVIVCLACSGCIGGGSNAQTYETNWGKIQIDIPQKVSVTGIEGGRSVTIMKDGGVSPLMTITISEASSFNPSSMSIIGMGATVNTVTSNDNHEIYWYLNPMGGFKQYLGYIDHTADKNLLVNFVLTPSYYDTAEGKIITAFEDEEVLSILKSFRFVDFKNKSTQPTETAKKPIYHMAVIGDSIAWGNGLKDEDKYSYNISNWIKEKLNRPVDLKVYAHSGATISGESGESIDQSLNSGTPTLMEQARSIKDKDDVDLILISGGINDVGVQNIFDPNTPSDTINKLSESIKGNMSDLIKYLLDQTNAKIIVTGYYPLITEKSNVDNLAQGVATLLALNSDRTASQMNVYINAIVNPSAPINDKATLWKDVFNNILNRNENLRSNSDTFYAISSNSLNQAVADANRGGDRVLFVDPMFGRSNSYGASDSFLWELEWVMTNDALKWIKTNDDQYEIRVELAKKTYPSNILKQAENNINPVAHPNRDGARKYADSIKSILGTPKRLDWLENGPTTNSEASITLDSITENSNTASVSETSSDTLIPSEDDDTPKANTKTAYTHDGISYISKERVEENIKAGVAKPGDYEEVQVPLDTVVVGGWKG